jgi:hypothetical protein
MGHGKKFWNKKVLAENAENQVGAVDRIHIVL